MSHEIEWDCQACGSQVEVLGQLGNRLHGRCRGCGLDQSRSADPYEGLSDDVADALGQRPTLIPGPDYHNVVSETKGVMPRGPVLVVDTAGPHTSIFRALQDLLENDEPFANDWKPRP